MEEIVISGELPYPRRSESKKQLLIPPLNFAYVEYGVYRCGYINEKNFPFLEKLKLTTIVYLVTSKKHKYEELKGFLAANHICLEMVEIVQNPPPFDAINPSVISGVLSYLLDTHYHPVLINSLKGRLVINCVIAALRRLQNWSLTSIYAEYQLFAKMRPFFCMDFQVIEFFEPTRLFNRKSLPMWVFPLSPLMSKYLDQEPLEGKKTRRPHRVA